MSKTYKPTNHKIEAIKFDGTKESVISIIEMVMETQHTCTFQFIKEKEDVFILKLNCECSSHGVYTDYIYVDKTKYIYINPVDGKVKIIREKDFEKLYEVAGEE